MYDSPVFSIATNLPQVHSTFIEDHHHVIVPAIYDGLWPGSLVYVDVLSSLDPNVVIVAFCLLLSSFFIWL